jgi:hypothetical protein
MSRLKVSELESELNTRDKPLTHRSSANAHMLSGLLHDASDGVEERRKRIEMESKLKNVISALETELALTKAELQVAQMLQSYSHHGSPDRSGASSDATPSTGMLVPPRRESLDSKQRLNK